VSVAIRCPVCRADNHEGPACRRCRADLALLFRLEGQREGALERARRHAQAGEATAALHEARRANHLRQGEDSRRLLALGHLLARDFARAWRLYTRANPLLSPEGAAVNSQGRQALEPLGPIALEPQRGDSERTGG